MPAHYSSEDLACALGLEGFANDSQIAHADASIRLLLQPSFDVELCLTMVKREGQCKVIVVRACEQIRMWEQMGRIPGRVATISAEAVITEEVFERLAAALSQSVDEAPIYSVICDGTLTHAVLRRDQRCQVNIEEYCGCRSKYSSFIDTALHEASQAVSGTLVRNALFVGTEHEKQIVQTLVLGAPDVTANILESLKRRHQS